MNRIRHFNLNDYNRFNRPYSLHILGLDFSKNVGRVKIYPDFNKGNSFMLDLKLSDYFIPVEEGYIFKEKRYLGVNTLYRIFLDCFNFKSPNIPDSVFVKYSNLIKENGAGININTLKRIPLSEEELRRIFGGKCFFKADEFHLRG